GRASRLRIALSKAPLARREMFVLCLRNVSERRESEQAMRESAARYRLLLDHAPEAIVVLDVDTGRFMDANDKAQKLFGLDRAKLLEVGPVTLSPPYQPDGGASEQRARAYIQQALEGETPAFEWTHLEGPGREIICEVRLARLPSGKRRLVRGSIADISERKRAERGAARGLYARAGVPDRRGRASGDPRLPLQLGLEHDVGGCEHRHRGDLRRDRGAGAAVRVHPRRGALQPHVRARSLGGRTGDGAARGAPAPRPGPAAPRGESLRYLARRAVVRRLRPARPRGPGDRRRAVLRDHRDRRRQQRLERPLSHGRAQAARLQIRAR